MAQITAALTTAVALMPIEMTGKTKMRFLLAICPLTTGLYTVAAHAAAAEAPDDLRQLVAAALEQNPELDSLQAQVEALEHKVTQVGAWKDPKLVVAYQNVPVDSLALGEEGMSMATIRLEQTIPFIGKTDDRQGVAQQAVSAKRWQLEERRSQLRALVKRAYYKLALARQLESITGQHIQLVLQLISAVRIKYEVGRAAQQNLLRLRVLRDRLADDLEDFKRQDAGLTAVLNAALHRDVATPVTTPKRFNVQEPSATVSSLQGLARESRPALKSLAATSQMHRAAADLARSEAIPDPTLFAAYGLRKQQKNGMGGRDLLTFGLAVPLPVFYGSRYGARAEESSSKARASDANQDALLDRIASALADALATWRRSAGKVDTYTNSLVPEAHRVLDATFSSYQVDRADFISLYEAEVELLKFERTIRTATVEGLMAQATIEMLVGKELP